VAQKVVRPEIDGDLLIFNWTEYMNPKVIRRFAKHYGVKVTVSNFDSMPGMMAKLRSGNRYDLIFPTADYVNRLNRQAMLRPLDRGVLKNSDGIYPFFDDPWYDKDSAHTVPYGMYTTGIAWRADEMGELNGSWNDLALEPAKGRTFMLDDFQEAIGQANLLNGFELNATAPEQLEQTKATLEHQKEYLRGYSTNAAPNLVNGSAWVHHAWNGDVVNARNQSKQPETLRFQTCREGIPVGSDCMAIPANARHPGTATLFIDWMLDPEHAAENVSWFGYPMPIKGTEDAFAELAADDPAIQITTDQLADGQQFRELSPEDKKAWDRVWTEVKA
jgi:spermidine/putrescine transport system substrate-binding protein